MIPLEQTTDFVVSGCSAGGAAVIAWVDWFRDQIHSVNPQVNVFGYSDSGIVIDTENVQTKDHDYSIKIKQLYILINDQVPSPQQACVKD